MKMYYIIGVLTVLLLIVGWFVFFADSAQQENFADAGAYESARAESEWGTSAPELPSCASSVDVEFSGRSVQAVTFTCASTNARTSFIAEIRQGFDWDILTFDNNRIRLEAAQ